MRNQSVFRLVLCGTMSYALAGCGESREVEVAGEVSAPASIQADGPILVELFDVVAEDDVESVQTVTLNELGAFAETVDLEGDTVRIVAIRDRDNNGACSAGEPWAQVEAAVSAEDTVEPVVLRLSNAACPVAGE
jgi:hypothetical protein